MRGLTEAEADAVVTIERVCSGVSLTGCLFVLVTFSLSPAFRQRAINRLVFLATFGNMLTNVATLMTRTYTSDINQFGCQFQGFLIQVFMQGDAYWALAMAVNVYLTFYHKYDARALRKMELFYILCCYGIPFIPGFVFLFVNTESKGRPYGNAVLWCWLRPEWDIYRIALFYGPVWVAILVTMAIYIRAGRDIYMKRRKMLNFRAGGGTSSGTRNGEGTVDSFFPINDFFSYKTTEVVHTTEIVKPPAAVATAGGVAQHGITPSSAQADRDNQVSYSVTISADKPADNDSLDEEDEIAITPARSQSPTNLPTVSSAANTGGVTISSSAGTSHQQAIQRQQQQARRRNEANNATWPYVKCAMLFFSVLLITWIPSSGNRVYSLINNGDVSKPLFFASAFVLPLQGFWNAIIYMTTSWAACKSLWNTIMLALPSWMGGSGMGMSSRRRVAIVEIASRNQNSHTHNGVGGGIRNSQRFVPAGGGGKWALKEESTSMEDLTGSKSSSTRNVDAVSPV
ncbi:hypothetical protein B0H66DRAFT_381383 [Apodospora peruviana]|uniref:G-protein coupled receptors family 2 profile 2 domain-containing protein n=1 Tax=Apodospora peruviana TaxID=516989 RepID=A0AAE0HUB5_9PEZI|nr:hypothetical protein B0H66DRAFT_381383 [Apodospora peruviana]